MTVILGLNLSDKIYLASDIRVTIAGKKSNPRDDCQKILPVGENCLVAVAGNLHLAQYLVKELKIASFINKGISEVRDKIEEWMKFQLDKYYSLEENSYTNVCLLFGGLDRSKKKEINFKYIYDYLNRSDSNELKNGGEFNESISNAIKDYKDNYKSGNLLLDVPFSTIFAVCHDGCKKDNNFLYVKDAGYGKQLVFGSGGISEEDIGDDLFGKFECSLDNGNYVLESPYIIARLKEISEFLNISDKVGGGFIVMKIDSLNISVVPQKVEIKKLDDYETISHIELIDNNFYAICGQGEKIKLIPVDEYPTIGTNSLDI
ncbi:MAG: Ntn hydrolase family protein [Patescibacteria group bacterium]